MVVAAGSSIRKGHGVTANLSLSCRPGSLRISSPAWDQGWDGQDEEGTPVTCVTKTLAS